MVSISKLLPVATLASLMTSVGAIFIAGMDWSVKDAPRNGVNKISFSFKVHKYTREGYYMASLVNFVNRNNGAVTGIQPNDDGSAQAMFSVYGPEASVVDWDNCHGDANGGPGVTCKVIMHEFELGKRYYFVVERESSSSRVWRGTVTDLSGYKQQIGAWQLAPEVGGLDAYNGQMSYLEFYYSATGCNLPYIDGTWYAAHVADPGVDNSRALTVAHAMDSDCKGRVRISQTQLPNKEATRIRAGF